MKLKICVVVGKYYNDAADDLIKGATSLLDKYKKFETVFDWKPSDTLSGMFEEFTDSNSSPRKHELEYKVLHAPGVFEIPFIISWLLSSHLMPNDHKLILWISNIKL